MTIKEIASKTSFIWTPKSYMFALMKSEATRAAYKQGFIEGYQFNREPTDAVSKYIKSHATLEIKPYPKYGPYDSLD